VTNYSDDLIRYSTYPEKAVWWNWESKAAPSCNWK
jgi:hypothetical protein